MKRYLLVLLILLISLPVSAVVEISRPGDPVLRIEEVYNVDGVPYVALDDVLAYLEIEGRWDSVEHLYHLPTAAGDAVFFPGGRYIRRGERFIPLTYPARFVDGRLRVPESFLTKHLPDLLGEKIAFRNLDPASATVARREGAIDRLFSFLLRRKKSPAGLQLRAVALDPGHGGEDVGVLGPRGVKEKDINFDLAVRLEKLLKMQLGIPVYMSRDGDYGLSHEQRLKSAMQEEVDAFLMLHAQGSFSTQHQGISLLIRPEESEAIITDESPVVKAPTVTEPLPRELPNESRRLAESLMVALKRAGFNVAGIKESPLFPLGRGDLPTVLIETGYLTNPEELAALRDAETEERLAQALFKGLKNFAHITRDGGSR